MDRVLKALGPYQKIVYSTASSTPEHPKCRAILALSDICRRPGHYRRAHASLRRALIERFAWSEEDIDRAGGDPARLWFLPTQPAGLFRFEVTDGRPVVLTDFAPEQPPPEPPSPDPPRTTTGEISPRYLGACLRGAVERLSSARPSERHRRLFSEAANLARLGFDDGQIVEALTYAFSAATPGEGREHECARTINAGIRAGRQS